MGKFPFELQQYSVFELLQLISDRDVIISNQGISPELYQFLLACCAIEPSKRHSAESLLQFEFITKYNKPDNKRQILKSWLEKVYLPAKEKKKKQEIVIVRKKESRKSTSGIQSSIIMSTPEDLLNAQ